jgi:hypothetical protein
MWVLAAASTRVREGRVRETGPLSVLSIPSPHGSVLAMSRGFGTGMLAR